MYRHKTLPCSIGRCLFNVASMRGFHSALFILQLALSRSTRILPSAEAWEPLRDLLSGWAFTDDFAVSAGVWHAGQHKQLFSHSQGNFSMQKEVYTGSTSKWPAAMMLAGAVADGTILSLDDPVHRYLKWWTISQQDPRSRVTLRHLLTFTSGFGDGNPGDNSELSKAPALQRKRSTRREVLLADAPPSHDKSDPLACMGNQSSDFEACAKTIYTVVGGEHGELLYGEPGHVYSYNSNHLQLVRCGCNFCVGPQHSGGDPQVPACSL